MPAYDCRTLCVLQVQSTATSAAPKTSRSRPLSSSGGSQFKISAPDSSDFCYFCGKRVYLMERMSANGLFFHRNCFKCSHCNCKLKVGNYSLSKGEGGEKGKFFCSVHYRQLFMSNPEAINYSRADAPKRETNKTELSTKKEEAIEQKNTILQVEATETRPANAERDDQQKSPKEIYITAEEDNEEVPTDKVKPMSEVEGRHSRERGSVTEQIIEEEREFTVQLEKKDSLVEEITEDTEEHKSDTSEVFVPELTSEEASQQQSDLLEEEEETRNKDVAVEEPHHQNGDDAEEVPSSVTVEQEVAPQMVEPEQKTITTDLITETTLTPSSQDKTVMC